MELSRLYRQVASLQASHQQDELKSGRVHSPAVCDGHLCVLESRNPIVPTASGGETLRL